MTSQEAGKIPERIRIRRAAKRASYDREVIDAILDAAPFCTVAVSRPDGPHCQPMIHLREGKKLYLHGASNNALLRSIVDGAPLCINATMLDGLILGRTIPDHSFRYRSANIYGGGRAIENPDDKLKIMRRVFERLTPERWESLPQLSEAYLARVAVVEIVIEDAVAKVNREQASADGPIDPSLFYGEIDLAQVQSAVKCQSGTNGQARQTLSYARSRASQQ